MENVALAAEVPSTTREGNDLVNLRYGGKREVVPCAGLEQHARQVELVQPLHHAQDRAGRLVVGWRSPLRSSSKAEA